MAGHPLGVVRKTRILQPFFVTQGLCQTLEQTVAAGGHHDLADVLSLERAQLVGLARQIGRGREELLTDERVVARRHEERQLEDLRRALEAGGDRCRQALLALEFLDRVDRLAERNLTLDELRAVLTSANANTPVGTLDGPRQTLTVQANRQLMNAKDWRQVIVATRNGAPVRLADVAQVQDNVESTKTYAELNGEPSITLAIQRQPDANTVQVVDRVKAMLPHFAAQLPASVKMTPVNDRSRSIREAVHDVYFTLALTAARDLICRPELRFAEVVPGLSDLPGDLPIRPYFRKFNPAETPIMSIALTSETLSMAQVYDAADSILAQRLSQVDGVAQVTINGAEKPAVRVRLDPVALAKALTLHAKDNPAFTFKAGMVEGRVINVAGINALATLPSKEEIFAKLLWVINAPAQQLVTVTNAVARNLAVVVDQGVKESKFQS